ncbi:hypothetical protein E4T56_gene12890 [Termitomyces sp. T112]|nr:hypothetical protein E4T56_gene12890 [Termitomyces sp. T112]
MLIVFPMDELHNHQTPSKFWIHPNLLASSHVLGSQGFDEYESFATPVSAATTFLFSLASNRTKSTFMPILGFINTVLRSNSAPSQRFGALNMTAALAS